MPVYARAARRARRRRRRVGAARRARAREREHRRRRAARVLDADRRRVRRARLGRAASARSSSPRRTARSTTRFPVLAAAPVEAIGLDLVRGTAPDADRDRGVARDKTLVAGVIDGHNIWRGDLAARLRASSRRSARSRRTSRSSTSTSLLPRAARRRRRDRSSTRALVSWLAFADQKVAQVATLARGLDRGPRRDPGATSTRHPLRSPTAHAAPGVRVPRGARPRSPPSPTRDFTPRRVRRARGGAGAALDLPDAADDHDRLVPADRRDPHARAPGFGKGELSRGRVRAASCATRSSASSSCRRSSASTCSCTASPSATTWCSTSPRTLDGFAVTQNGWVQSYGSRCTRPSILWGDVSRPAPMTVEWSTLRAVAHREARQGHAHRPGHDPRVVVRARRPAARRHRQPGGARPARRDRRPRGRRHRGHPGRRAGAARAAAAEAAPTRPPTSTGRSARSGSRPPGVGRPRRRSTPTSATRSSAWSSTRSTTSTPTSPRSRRRAAAMEVVDDISSERLRPRHRPGRLRHPLAARAERRPRCSELLETRRRPRSRRARLWVNPDCGLKTRGYDETVASLEHMLEATRAVRAELAQPVLAD